MDSNPSSPGSIGGGHHTIVNGPRKESKGRRKQSYPSKAPVSPVDYSEDEPPHDFTAWPSKLKRKVCYAIMIFFPTYILKIKRVYFAASRGS